MNWSIINPIDGNTGGHHAISKRIYGQNGKQYPRLSIAIYKDPYYDGFIISCNEKTNKEDYWNSRGIPVSLFGDLKEIMDEVIK